MSKHKVELVKGGFKVGKSEQQEKRDKVKTKATPTNRDIADLLEQVLEKLDK